MNLVTAVQFPQHLQGANLPSAVGWMQKIRFDPENFHQLQMALNARVAVSIGAAERKNRCPQSSRLSNRQRRSVASTLPNWCAEIKAPTASRRTNFEMKLFRAVR